MEEKNGNGNGPETGVKRNAKGQFLPGNKEGGRKKKPKGDVSYEDLMRILLDVLNNNDDPKLKIAAIKAILALVKSPMSEDNESEIFMFDPRVEKIIKVSLGGILEDPEVEAGGGVSGSWR